MKNANLMKNSNNKTKKKNIALIGHMGSGKSTIGKLLANKLNFLHIDSDKLVERKYGKSINKIFQDYGEKFFRNAEKEEVLSLDLDKNSLILSLGGGAILNKEIREFLQKKFITIFLDVDIEKLVYRLKKSSKRPLLIGSDIETKVKELDSIRRKYYLLADIRIKNINDASKAINEILKKI
tara:strand:- start:206 stop:748 length:543 start_codon:yes stop_codon:yes gene_type:complete